MLVDRPPLSLDDLVAALNTLKKTGAWQRIVADSGVHYDTVARIARGVIANPGARTVERLSLAVQGLAEKA